MTLHQALQDAIRRIAAESEHADSAKLDAEVLLGCVLQKPRSYLFTWPERELSEAQQFRFRDLIDRRCQGMPVAYLVGEREFWSLPLQVTEHTLIPRPETELLVELALERLPADGRLVDLGTGTGAIALALASERPRAEIWAVDASADALAVAAENARRMNLRVRCLQSNWLSQLSGERFHVIVSNPPYIAENDVHLEQGDVRFEPRSALVSGTDGLDDIRRIVHTAPAHLYDNGWLLFEHGFQQGDAVRELLEAAGFALVATVQDYAGLDRVTLGRWIPPA